MLFQTYGDRRNPAVLFFHAMGVTGSSSEPIARCLQDRYFCILPTSTVYCEGQKYVSKLDEIRQVEDFLQRQGVERLAMVVASSTPVPIPNTVVKLIRAENTWLEAARENRSMPT